MKFLFIHQNFPGQFINFAAELVRNNHEVTALTLNRRNLSSPWMGIEIVEYSLDRGNGKDIFSPVVDFETKAIRGACCYLKAIELKSQGYSPDIIISHPGWGESLFLKEIWPNALLKIYCEFYYHTSGYDVGFDREFEPTDQLNLPRVQLKNTTFLLQMEKADSGISPTNWQASTFPAHFRPNISVIHDGIDTRLIKPVADERLCLPNGKQLTRSDEIVTYVSRSLEPYRGFHSFMRSLPGILKTRKNAIILIVGEEGTSYGAKPPAGKSWKGLFLAEIRPLLSNQQFERINFLGKVSYSTFKQVLCVSTVHVYLTYPFVLSWSLLEAMATACAIVGSKTSPVEEVIEDNKTGVLVDFFEYEEIAARVVELLENPDKRVMLGTYARELVARNYDLKSKCLPEQIAWAEER